MQSQFNSVCTNSYSDILQQVEDCSHKAVVIGSSPIIRTVWFSKMGYTVNIPITDSQDYDLIIDREGKLLKVQVKTTKFKIRDGVYQVSLKTCGGNRSGQTIKNFNENGSDLLFVLTDEGTTYLIPKEDIHSNTCINLNTTLEEYRVYL